MEKTKLKIKKYLAGLTLVLLVTALVGLLKINNFDKLSGKVKIKDAYLSNINTKLSSNVFDASSDNALSSNGFDQINYELKYKVSDADRDVIITGILNDDERYASFKKITGENISSTLSNNNRKIEIVISNAPANTEITTNVLLLINGAPDGYTINPRFQIKESTSDSFDDIYTNPITVSTNNLRGTVRNIDGTTIDNVIVSLYKNRELIKETYTNSNGEYIFSDLNEDSYIIKINEEIYKDVSLNIDVNKDTVLDIETERVYPFKLEVHKYITKVDAYNNGLLISRSYDNANLVNFPIDRLNILTGKVYYKIVVENTNEKEGIVSLVKDELPKFMTFNEEENSGFELKDGIIYDRNLEGVTLYPGEKKEDTLVLNILDTNEARTYLNRVDINGEIYEHVVYLLDGNTYKELDVLEGETITKPADPIPNFGGWYTDNKYTNLYNYNNPVTKDLILYGKTAQKYNVEFYDKNPETGDETLYDEEEVPAGDPVDEPENHPEYTGYDFDYWCKVDNTKYNFNTPVTEDLKLITCYTVKKYDINFYNYEDTKEKTIQVEYKHLIDETLAPTFDETGYTFLCWTKDKTNCYDFTTPVTENVDLYPTHKKLKNAVVFNDENRITTKEVPYGDTVEPVDNQGKTGHTFRCWSEDRENCFDFNTPIIQNTTVYAVYDINKFTVHFIDRDPEYGTDVQYGDDQIIDYGNTATKPIPDPTHTGYTFSEWKNGEETYNFDTPVTSDITLISNYSINTYPVRFHNDSEVTTVNVEYKHKVTPIESPTKDHHIFSNWLDINDLPFDFDTLIVDETDLYSSFEEVLSPKISHLPTMWTNSNVTVTIEKNDSLDDDTGYSYLYKTEESTYSDYENPFTVNENTTVIAKSVKQNVDSVVSNHEIVNIDKLNPTITLFSENTVNKNSATLNVGVRDDESGINYYEVYQDNIKVGEKHFECYNETTFDEYEICRKDLPAERVNTYTVTGLTQSTTYRFKIKAYDKAGNYVLSDEIEVTTTTPQIVARLIGYNNELFEDTVDPSTGDVIVPKEDKYINFESLAEAFDYEDLYDCKNVQCTIQMVLGTNESVEVLEGQNLTLDLNGKVVSGVNNEYTIKNNGEFTLIESTPETSDPGKLINTQGVALLNKTGASFTLGEGYADREVLTSIVSITRPYIYGETVGVKNEKNGNFSFFDGIIVAPATTISGQGAVNGEVTAAEYSYTPSSNGRTIDDRNYQEVTLSKIIDPEARVNKGIYYNLLTSAMSNVKDGTISSTSESGNLMNDLKQAGQHYFVYDETTGKWVSNNSGVDWFDVAKSKLIIDLRNETNNKILNINYSVDLLESGESELDHNYSYRDIYTGKQMSSKPVNMTVNEYNNRTEELGNSVNPYHKDHTDYNFELKAGEVYILNIQYLRPGNTLGDMTINSITLSDVLTDSTNVGIQEDISVTSYGFYYDDNTQTIRSSNQYNNGNSMAVGYIDIDLTDPSYGTDQYQLIINANMESYYYNALAEGRINVIDTSTNSSTNLFNYRTNSYPDVQREGAQYNTEGFASYGPDVAKMTLTGGKKYKISMSYTKTDYAPDNFPSREEFIAAGCSDQLIINSIDVVKVGESTKISTNDASIVDDDFLFDLLQNSNGTFTLASDNKSITTNNNKQNQVSESHTTIDLRNNPKGLILLFGYEVDKGSASYFDISNDVSGTSTSNYYRIMQKSVVDGVEVLTPVSKGGGIKLDPSDSIYYNVIVLPGGYEYEFSLNVTSPSQYYDVYPNVKIVGMFTENLDKMEGNYFNGFYPYNSYTHNDNLIISNNIDKISEETWKDSFIKIDLSTKDKNQLLTVYGSYYNPYDSRYYIYLSNNNRALSYEDLFSNRNKEAVYIGSKGYGNRSGSSYSSERDTDIVLEKGNVYYLHFATKTYKKNNTSTSISGNGNYSMKINDIKISPIEKSVLNIGGANVFTGTVDVASKPESKMVIPKRTSGEPIIDNADTVYGFEYNNETGMYDALNNDVGTVAAKVFKMDLTETQGNKTYYFDTVGGYNNAYYVSEDENIPPIDLNNYKAGNTGSYTKISDAGSFKLESGKVYYVQVLTYKQTSETTPFSVKIAEIEGENTTTDYEKPKEVKEFNEKVDTVQLLKDVNTSQPINVDYAEEVVLDLNGYNLTSSNQDYVINNSGNLTILDSKYESGKAQYEHDLPIYQEYAGLCDGCEPSAEYILDHSIDASFDYTGNEQIFTATYEGDYKLEAWGAQGGDAYFNTTCKGGYGGYSTGTIHLNAGDKLYINVGGTGKDTCGYNASCPGGYNGGGSGYTTTHSANRVGSGGGATHIAKVSGTLNNLEANKGSLSQDETYYISNDIIIVAGGGGGATNNYSYTSRYDGGPAGGKQGSIPSGTTNRTKHITGAGGSQTTGCTSFINYNSSYGNMDSTITNGSFGLGGSHSSTNDMYAAGGGGGFYGGAIGYLSGGTGGSGYIANPSLTDKTMVMYGTDTSLVSTDTETKTELTQNISEEPKENYAKIGNGYARVTLISSAEEAEARSHLPKTYDVKEEPDDSYKNNLSSMTGNSNKQGIVYNDKDAELTLGTATLNVNSKYGIYNRGDVIIDGEPTIKIKYMNSTGIANVGDANIKNNGKLNIDLSYHYCGHNEYSNVGISYSLGEHDISNINITGKDGTGLLVDEGTKVNMHSSSINLTDTCSTFSLGNPKDTTELPSYDKNFSYTSKIYYYVSGRYYYYYNRNDGPIYNKGTINIDNGSNIVGTINNFGIAKLYNGVGFTDIYQNDKYRMSLLDNYSRYSTIVNFDNPELYIYNTVATVNKIVNKGGTLNIIEEEGKTSSITSSSSPAIINLDKMNTIGGSISSVYNLGTLDSNNTNYNKFENIHSYDGHTLTNTSYNHYDVIDPKFTDKAGTANIKGGTISDSQLINESDMTIDGTTVPNGIINRGNLIVQGDSVVTGTNKTAIFNSPFKLRNYNSSGTIMGYGYPETSLTLGSDDNNVTAGPTITTSNDNYAITGDCYANKTIPLSGFKFNLINNNYLSFISAGESEDIVNYPNNYANLCKMNYYDGTITNTKLTDMTDVVDLPIKNIASGYDVLYDNSNNVGKVTLDTIDSSSRSNIIDVDGIPYKSLETAIANANNDSIINITGNYDSANRVTIPSDKNLTININAGVNVNSYSKDALINNNGTLAITGDGTNNVIGAAAYQNNGNMVINGTNVTNNIDYYYKQSSLVLNNSSLTIDDINSNNLDIISINDDIDNGNELIINNGVFNSNTVYGKNANIVLTGGYFDTTQNNNYQEYVPNINGSNVDLTTVNTKAMFNVDSSNVTFNSFDEDSDSRYSSIALEQNLGTFKNGSTLNLNNSVVGGKSSKSAIYTTIDNGSHLNVNGGTYNNMYFFLKDNLNTYNQTSGTVNGELLVNGNSNAVTITGGKLLSTYDSAIFLLDSSNTTITVGTKGDLIPGTEDLNVSKTDPEIKGSTYGVSSAGTTLGENNIYFYDGIFKASGNPIDIHVEEIETGYDVVFKRNKSPKEKYLDILPTIYNYTTDTFYYDIQQAFNTAEEDDELIWLRDYTNFADSPSLVVGQDKKFTLYLSYIDDGNEHYSPYSGSETVPTGSEVMAPIIYINNKDIVDEQTGEITEVPFIINNGELTVIAGAKGESANTGTYAINTNFETLSGTEIFTNNGTLNLNKVTAINIKNRGTMFKNTGSMNIYQGDFETLQANIIDNYGTLNFVGDEDDTSTCYNTSKIKILYDDELGTILNEIINQGGDVHQVVSEPIINNNNAIMNIKYLYFNGDYAFTAILNNGTMTIKNSGIEQYRDGNYPNTLSIDKVIINNGTMETTELNTFSTRGILNTGTLNYSGGNINAVFDTGIVNTNILTFSGNLQGAYRGIEDTGTQANIMNYISTAGEAYHGTGPGTVMLNGSFKTNGSRYSGYGVNYSINTTCNNGTAGTETVSGTINNPWTYNINNGTVYVGAGKTLDITRGASIGFNTNLTSLAHFCGNYTDPITGRSTSACNSPYNHKGEGGRNYTVSAVELENANMIMSTGTINGHTTNTDIRGLYAKNSTITLTGGYISSAFIENSAEDVTFGVKDGVINSQEDGSTTIGKLGCDSNYKGISIYNGSYLTLDRDNYCHLYDKEDDFTFVGWSYSPNYSPHNLVSSTTTAINITKGIPYDSLEEAVAAATPGDNIRLNGHVIYPRGDYDIEINKDITLDLYGYTQDYNLNITAGTTTITDSQYAADNTKDRGKLSKVTNTSGALNITEGIFESIVNDSTTNVNGGYVKNITSSGTLNISSGEVVKTISSGILNVTGGTFPVLINRDNIRNTGTATITGVTIPDIINIDSGVITLTGSSITTLDNNGQGIINLSGDANVIATFYNNSSSSMTFASGTVNKLYNYGNGIITIDGVNITSKLNNDTGDLIINSGNINNLSNGSNVTINGGTINTITNSSYRTITINNGDIGSITNGGTLNILDGTIRFITNQSTGVLTIGTKDGIPSATNPKVYNPTGNYAILNSGTFNYYDGIFTAKDSLVISGIINDVETDYSVYTAPDYDEESQLTGTYSMILKPAAETDTKIACVNGICYNTLQEAINASVQNCDETNICPMVVIGDQFFFSVELDEDLVLAPQYSLTINLNQHNLNKNGYNIPDNITVTNGTIDGNNLQSSLARFLSNVFDSNNSNKNIIITNMEDGNALDTAKTYNLYKYEDSDYLLVNVSSDGAGKYAYGKGISDMKPIKGRLYLNDMPSGEYKLKDNYDNELEFTIYDDGTLSPNIRENVVSEFGHLSASAVATLIITIQTGIIRFRFILIILLIIIGLAMLLLMKKNKSLNKKETTL